MTRYTGAMRYALAAVLLALTACGQAPSTTDAGPMPDAFDPGTVDAYTACTLTCAAVQLCCETSRGQRCLDYYSDPENCGACGRRCLLDTICVSRECVPRQ